MGCGGSKSDGSGAKNDNPDIDSIEVEDVDPNGPPPQPPPNTKKDIFDENDFSAIDDKARQIAKSRFMKYETLLESLTETCTTDIQKARAIFVWLYHQDIYGSWYNGITDPHTLMGYMKLIKLRKGSLASFYALLCRAAGIPCNVLRGPAKGTTYHVGQQDMEDMEGAWCAIYISKGWRLVHLFWAYFEEKRTYEQGLPPIAGTKRSCIQEFFWLVDPTKMICFCKPLDDEWQLLKSKWDFKKFVQSPRLTEDYFSSGLMLPKKYNAVISTDTGMCIIDFDHNDNEQVCVRAEADLVEPASSNDGTMQSNLTEHVVVVNSSSSKSVVLRCPTIGSYVVFVFGGRVPSPKTKSDVVPKIAEFRIECSDISKDPQPFPLNPENGFGIQRDLDLLNISEIRPDSGIVYVEPGQRKTFTVRLQQNQEVHGRLFHNTIDAADLQTFIEKSCTDSLTTFDVTMPHEKDPEFGFEISIKDPNDGKDSTVATYLLVDKNWAKKKSSEPPVQDVSSMDSDQIRRSLIDATKKDDIECLEKAIAQFERHNLPDKGHLTQAKRRLVELHKENLKARTNERKLDTLETAIDNAKTSVVANELIHSKEMLDAEATRRQLKRLRLYMHKILELNKATISEIHSYKKPRPLVHTVMKATFRILGETNRKLEDWSFVQTSMRKLGQNSMINRMKRLDLYDVREPQIRDAEKHLSSTNRYLVRMCSAGAGTFFVWSNNMVSEYHGKDETRRLD